MATVHLLSGLPCAGKTTYATQLRAKTNGVVFTLDRWLITLFGRYSIGAVGYDEHRRRVLACRQLIWESGVGYLQRSVDVILDDGFFFREHRVRHVNLAREVGADAAIHFLTAKDSVIRSRLEQRNAQLPTFNFHIDPQNLEAFAEMFQPPTADEGAELVIVDVEKSVPSK